MSRAVTLDEAARLTDRSVTAMRRLADRGTIPTTVVRGRRMVRIADLHEAGLLKVDLADAERAGNVDTVLERVERLGDALSAAIAELRVEIAAERTGRDDAREA